MLDWSDQALILSVRPLGETASIAHVLTRARGKHGGVARGAVPQPGAWVSAAWRARLADHLGSWRFEERRNFSVEAFADPPRLATMVAACAVLERALPEREPLPTVYAATLALFEAVIDSPFWAEAYILWELGLLDALGFGLDLRCCAVTGSNANLRYVSPRSGRAVSEDGAGVWRDRLLPLPAFLIGRGLGGRDEILSGLRLTGYFLNKHVFSPQGGALPTARDRLVDRLAASLALPDDAGPNAAAFEALE